MRRCSYESTFVKKPVMWNVVTSRTKSWPARNMYTALDVLSRLVLTVSQMTGLAYTDKKVQELCPCGG